MQINLPEYMHPHMENLTKRYHFLHGGRGAAKTTSVCIVLVMQAYRERHRILCCREIQKSMEQSTYKSIEKAINYLGLRGAFKFTKTTIKCYRTGSEFIFKGLSTNIYSLSSMEDLTIAYCEEAQSLTELGLRVLRPTMRSKGSSMWFAWNCINEDDPIEDLRSKVLDEAIDTFVTYEDNPYMTEELELERQLCLKHEPADLYAHIWEGLPLRQDQDMRVLPYASLMQCVGAAEKLGYKPEGWADAGLDLADGGRDKTVLCIRRGSLVESIEEIAGDKAYQIVNNVYPRLVDKGVARCYYDAVGIGAGTKSEFARRAEEIKQQNKSGARDRLLSGQVESFLPFKPVAYMAGSSPQGGNKPYAAGRLNREYFRLWNSQAYWGLRLRMEETLLALDGRSDRLDKCLFLPKNTPKQVIKELTQVTYSFDSAHRITIVKKKDNEASPDMADAVSMAFLRDNENGLRVR